MNPMLIRVHLIIDILLSITCTAAACVVLTDIRTPIRPILVLIALDNWMRLGDLRMAEFS